VSAETLRLGVQKRIFCLSSKGLYRTPDYPIYYELEGAQSSQFSALGGGKSGMRGTDINPRTFPPFERKVVELLQQILRKLESIEQQMPNPRDSPENLYLS